MEPFAATSIDVLEHQHMTSSGRRAAVPKGGAFSRSAQEAIFGARRAALFELLDTNTTVMRAVALITRLRRTHGLTCSVHGLKFQWGLPIIRSPDVMAALRLLVIETAAAPHIDTRLVTMWLWESDQRNREGRKLSQTAVTAHSQLRRDGFLKVASWASYGLDVRALVAEASVAFEAMRAEQGRGKASPSVSHAGSPSALRDVKRPLPSLDPLLRNNDLARVINDYLGGAARYEGHMLLELTPSASADSYRSAIWHHDRCGRRLKLFIYLDDVSATTGRPTLVARGTHDMAHFNSGMPYGLSRFREEHVAARYAVEPLDAPTGGGFLLDTNALHRAAVERGNRTRQAVVLEFHAHGKVQTLGKVDNPCPWGRPSAHTPKRMWQNKHFWSGVASYAHYPPESSAPKTEAMKTLWEGIMQPYNRALAAALGMQRLPSAWRYGAPARP